MKEMKERSSIYGQTYCDKPKTLAKDIKGSKERYLLRQNITRMLCALS